MRQPLSVLALVVLALAGCSGRSPADAPSSSAATREPPTTAAQSVPPAPSSTTIATPAATPIPQPVPLGQAVQIAGQTDELFTVVVHGLQRLDVNPAIGATEPLILVDWSVRNDGQRPYQWLSGSGLPALLSASGERLNEEPLWEGVPLLDPADMGPGECVSRLAPSGLGLLNFTVSAGGLRLQPGMVYRTFSAFAATPGTETPDLQFEVSIPISNVLGAEPNRVRFNLAGTPTPQALAWVGPGAAPGDSGEVSEVQYRDARAEAVRPGRPSLADTGDPCGLSRVVRVTVENLSARSLSIAGGSLLLVDEQGRMYGPLDDPFVDIAPRSSAEVVVTFPALSGERGRPVALLIPGYELDQWTVISVENPS